MTSDNFQTQFVERIIEEFDASEKIATEIATMATEYMEDAGSEKSVEDWIEWMDRGRGDAAARWNYAIGMVAGEYYETGDTEKKENPYQL